MQASLHGISGRRPGKAGDDTGFTLIELIVVTALIGIMLSIAIPPLRNALFSDPLKSTTRKLIGLVTGVRELAVRSQQPYLLHISQLENRIWYERELADIGNQEKDPLQKGELLFPASVNMSRILVATDEGSSAGQTVVWISKQGYMNNILLRLEDDSGNHLNVQFYPFLEPALVSDQATSF
jgi:prepilin-type N-terminal cleavage/methylation domain-containing protein